MKLPTSSGRESIRHLEDKALQGLDPASEKLNLMERGRAEDTLRRVLHSDPGEPIAPAYHQTRPARRMPSWRWVALPVTAAAVIGAVAIGGLGGNDTAYAGWSATPTPLEPSQAIRAGEACREYLTTRVLGPDTDGPMADVANFTTQVSESRGGWTFVSMTGAESIGGACLMPSAAVNRLLTEADKRNSSGYVASTQSQVISNDANVDITAGGFGRTEEGDFFYATGVVSDDVAAVDIISNEGQQIEASLADGHLAAWWPLGSSDPDHGAFDFTITVTLKDGTVLDR